MTPIAVALIIIADIAIVAWMISDIRDLNKSLKDDPEAKNDRQR